MTVGLLLITHEHYGDVTLQIIRTILGVCPLDTKSLSVPFDANTDNLFKEAQAAIENLDKGSGVLILTDLFGATPSNIAHRLIGPTRIVVTGLNLSMLMRVMNYPNLSLMELVDKAASGAREGVIVSTYTNR